ncbi:MAG: class I SAM-dependent methyltransferase [Pseudomonadota bacterium]
MLDRFMEKTIAKGRLVLCLPNGRRHAAGDGTGPKVTLRFANWRTMLGVLFNPHLRLGEAYMDGTLILEEGDVYDLLSLLALNASQGYGNQWFAFLGRLRRAWRRVQQFNPAFRARRNAAHHYDIDGRVYDLFLDRDRQYSCAYFSDPEMTLDAAQAAKKAHIARKLCLAPGQSVLDIGCGWGGLALDLAGVEGAKVTGITLSQAQLRVAEEKALRRGLASRVDFRLADYRALKGPFDRIVSVGMFEHVGVGYYRTFFNQVARLLTQNGVALIHSIGRSDGPGATNPWIAKYIFPGGYIPALSEILPHIERAGLVLTDIEVWRLHYAETLAHWRRRFAQNRAKAAQWIDERFCRMWEFYLAASEASFRWGGMVVYQLQVARVQDAVPLTRDYLYVSSEPAVEEQAIPWRGQRTIPS